jgi:hypothetical protein
LYETPSQHWRYDDLLVKVELTHVVCRWRSISWFAPNGTTSRSQRTRGMRYVITALLVFVCVCVCVCVF